MTASQDEIQSVLRHYLRRRYAEAASLCGYLLARDPQRPAAAYLRGLILYRTGYRDEGMQAIEQAMHLCPEIRRYDDMLGHLRQQGRDDWIGVAEARFQRFCKMERTDAFILSFPKSGRTWLRAMLGRYLLEGRPGDPLEVDRITRSDPRLPVVDLNDDDFPQLKPYTDIHEDKSIYAEKTVALLVRDPRDVVVSNFFQYTRRGGRRRANDEAFAGTLADFVRYPIGGLLSVVRFYNVWARARGVPRRFHLMTYEGLHADTRGEFRRLIEFLGLPDHGPAAIEDALAFGSFDNLRALEEANALDNARLRPSKDRDPEGFKVRRGKVGGYRDYLAPEDILYVDEYLSAELDDFYAFYKPASV